MIAYILKSSLSLLLMFSLYWFLLRKEKLFGFNRYFLIFSILFSLIIPLISIPVNVRINEVQGNVITALNINRTAFSPEQNPINVIINQPFNEVVPAVVSGPSRINLFQILIILYFTGIIILLFRFILNIFYIFRHMRLSEKITYSGHKLALVDHQITPFSFLKTIFVNKYDYFNNKIAREVFAHEAVHIRQSHTIDIIFIELIQIIYWFNPILILYNRAIRVNHEYLADNDVIRNSSDIKGYANTLLSYVSCRSNIPLTSGLYPSLNKKRLIMMTKTRSKNISNGIKIILIVSSTAVIFFMLSCKPSNSQTSNTGKNSDGLQGMQAKSVKDIDGNVYKTVTIGNYIWMAENLKTTKYNDGKKIPLVKDNEQWQKYEQAFCWYENNEAERKDNYGALYNWYAVNTDKLCPSGWHVPNKEELMSLMNSIPNDTITGGSLKEAGTIHWSSPNLGATNETGFTALPGGLRKYNGEFIYSGEQGTWWTSGEENDYIGFGWLLTYNDSRIHPAWPSKRDGFSVRCLKDYYIDSKSTNTSTPITAKMVDFSGKWILNRSRGKSFLTEVASSTIVISQDNNSITMDITITPDKSKGINRTEKYIYNTSIAKKNTQGDKTAVITCAPSPDGQSFSITETLSYTQNGIEKVSKRISVYSLGEEGKTLIINQGDTLPEGSLTPENERHETRVYDKSS